MMNGLACGDESYLYFIDAMNKRADEQTNQNATRSILFTQIT